MHCKWVNSIGGAISLPDYLNCSGLVACEEWENWACYLSVVLVIMTYLRIVKEGPTATPRNTVALRGAGSFTPWPWSWPPPGSSLPRSSTWRPGSSSTAQGCGPAWCTGAPPWASSWGSWRRAVTSSWLHWAGSSGADRPWCYWPPSPRRSRWPPGSPWRRWPRTTLFATCDNNISRRLKKVSQHYTGSTSLHLLDDHHCDNRGCRVAPRGIIAPVWSNHSRREPAFVKK